MISSICVVLTTFNRLDKLKKALICYSHQKLKPKYVIVVDNASTDNTLDFLKIWQTKPEGFEKIIIHSKDNLGGSGGFYLGERYFLKLDADWVLVADDDAYLEEDYLLGMNKYIESHDTKNISVLCGKVIQNGTYLNKHRARLRSKWIFDFDRPISQKLYDEPSFYPDFVSYVGILIQKSKLLQAGLVDKDFFIWRDDSEHSCRLRKYGKIVCIPQYTIVHDADEEHKGYSWKSYYGYRNGTVLFKRHYPLQFPFVIIVLLLKSLLCPLNGKTWIEVRLRLVAVKDGILGRLGKHPTYKSGWKPGD